MPLKIFLTADIHLGMKFAGYPEDVQDKLIEARFKTLENLVNRANKERCDLFVVAGDLFNRVSVAKRDIVRAAQILSEFQGRLATILPGNHDYISTGQIDLWTHFLEKRGDNTIVIKENKVISLKSYEIDANLYPAPCSAKHSSENGIGWIRGIEKDESVKYHIGIAHGSLKGFSPDFENKYYPMTSSELLACNVDLWLLGHTHNQHPAKPDPRDRIFYPATPEPDGFDCDHEGKAWIIEIDENKKVSSSSISVGTYRFMHDEGLINTEADLDSLKQRYTKSVYKYILLKLKLSGRLPEDAHKNLPGTKEAVEKQMFYLQWDDSEVTKEVKQDDINNNFTQDSFPHKLLMELIKSEEDHEALQEAYELIMEVRK